jgi:ribosomal protein S18 acetylase RimI-like enzyme
VAEIGPVQIASARATDVKRLFGLAKETFGLMRGWNDERVLDVLRWDVVFVAHERAQPAGHVALHRDAATGAIVIDQLFVAPGHERRGVGRRLLGFAEGYAITEGAASLWIVVEESNWGARHFYGRAGFVPVEAELFERVLPRLG